MKPILTTPILLTLVGYLSTAAAQPRPLANDSLLARQVLATGLAHAPLPVDTLHTMEAAERRKPVTRSHDLLGPEGHVALSFATTPQRRAVGSPGDPDYATYGDTRIAFGMDHLRDWSAYNRLYFEVYPVEGGARVMNLNVRTPAGSHLVNLVPGRWNTCTLNLDGYPRAEVRGISFTAALNGRDQATADSITYLIRNVRLQQVERPLKTLGWMPDTDAIVYSTTGYRTGDAKTAIVNGDTRRETTYSLVDASTGAVVHQGAMAYANTTIGRYGVADFSGFRRAGSYILRVGDLATPPFRIADTLWDDSLWRVVSFLFGQRCGHPVPGVHGTCHPDLFSEHDGRRISYAGGWHDAGDLSQQTLQTGDVTFALLEAYRATKATNPALAARLLEEARWGLEFILRQRYGDGYRASSMGLLIWLDGVERTFDDISSVRLQNHSFDNFLHAAYEAYAAMTIDDDPALRQHLIGVAAADYDFASKQYADEGIRPFAHIYEHSYNTSESQYVATAAWASALMHQLTGKEEYARRAIDFGSRLLAYQQPAASPGKAAELGGYFCRDLTRRMPVHFNHQSRDAIYMQALTLLIELFPRHADATRWTDAVRAYGDYLKALMPYTAPYGMVPSGTYRLDEPTDEAGFSALNIFAGEGADREFAKYVRAGARVDDLHYVRRFPPWFTIYNGNTAVMLATGKAAALCGKALGDEELLRVAAEQLYWTVGKNPFGQSLIYGEGRNYPQMNSFSSGELTGEMPVGIRTLDATDVPYWPQTNNACYKEVWTTSAGKWISLVASLTP
ncbi:MAG: glycoside hydrolase family 9 protein [Mediterranea sp.]|jgi:hypothetical protein|nr:glycoside hydrolase family 9 protein [Mediterranea sp.]